MKWIYPLIFTLLSCSSFHLKEIESTPAKILNLGQGSILQIGLDSKGMIKRGKVCYLVLNSEGVEHLLSLREGTHAYGIPKEIANFKVTELNCGPFYYYKFKERILAKSTQEIKIVYLGYLNFELEDKGKLDWGRDRNSQSLYEAQAMEHGLSLENTLIQPLEL